ncbi:hypothetical protein KJ632_05295 [Patescibacteria group bacterium]|nr:hypothetical protein [Patescibacteria group bacterium]
MRNFRKKTIKLQVKKRSGDLEAFDPHKLQSSFFAAGLENREEVAGLVQKLVAWIQETAKDGSIETQAMWTKVSEMLKEIDPQAAERYESFRRESIIGLK